jgi:cytoskeleton protein RodZ
LGGAPGAECDRRHAFADILCKGGDGRPIIDVEVGVFGDQLKEEREARGLSLEAIADATRIAPHHLAALERSDVTALPAGPFAKGYIEGYARFLGIDPEPILEAYRHEGRRRGLDAGEAQDRIVEELSRLVEQRERTAGAFGLATVWKRVGLAFLAIVVVGSIGYGGWLLSRGGASSAPVAPPPLREEAGSPVEDTPGVTLPNTSDATGEVSAERSSSREASRTAIPLAVAEPAGPEPGPGATNELEVSRSGVGTGVENHELVGRGDRFPEGARVVFWTHVLGGDPGDVVHHVWVHEGEVVTRADLVIGSPSFRTHSRRLLEPGLTGRWVVEARRPDGTVLARHEFLCVPAERP